MPLVKIYLWFNDTKTNKQLEKKDGVDITCYVTLVFLDFS